MPVPYLLFANQHLNFSHHPKLSYTHLASLFSGNLSSSLSVLCQGLNLKCWLTPFNSTVAAWPNDLFFLHSNFLLPFSCFALEKLLQRINTLCCPSLSLSPFYEMKEWNHLMQNGFGPFYSRLQQDIYLQWQKKSGLQWYNIRCKADIRFRKITCKKKENTN